VTEQNETKSYCQLSPYAIKFKAQSTMSATNIKCYLLAALMVATWGKGPTATECRPLL